MTQVAHVLVRHAGVVLGAQCSRYAALAEVLGRRAHGVAAVTTYPAVRQQVGHRDDPAGCCVDAGVTRVLACNNTPHLY